MSKDVTDLLVDGQSELSAQIARMRDQMTAEHKALGERVAKLEFQNKILMFAIAPAGVIIGMVLRQVIGTWF